MAPIGFNPSTFTPVSTGNAPSVTSTSANVNSTPAVTNTDIVTNSPNAKNDNKSNMRNDAQNMHDYLKTELEKSEQKIINGLQQKIKNNEFSACCDSGTIPTKGGFALSYLWKPEGAPDRFLMNATASSSFGVNYTRTPVKDAMGRITGFSYTLGSIANYKAELPTVDEIMAKMQEAQNSYDRYRSSFVIPNL